MYGSYGRYSLTNQNESTGAAAFDPSDLTLEAWYDASDTSSISDTAGLVTQWNDLSGGAFHFTPAAGVAGTTNSRTQNSLNCIDLDGTEYFTKAGFNFSSSTVMFNVAYVIDSVGAGGQAVFSIDNSIDFQVDAQSGTQFDGRVNLSTLGTTFSLTGGPYSGITIFQLVFDWANTNIEMFVNGASRGSTTYSTELDVLANYQLKIGVNRFDNGPINGAACEYFVCTEVDATSRGDAYTYLSNKWVP